MMKLNQDRAWLRQKAAEEDNRIVSVGGLQNRLVVDDKAQPEARTMTALRESTCPGCGLRMPISDTAVYRGYFNASPECWMVFTEVLGKEFGNAVLFGQVHQLTVDTYAVQHAGGIHPDKSMGIHLAGLHLVLDRGIRPPNVPKFLQRLAKAMTTWPHFPPPAETGPLTVFDVAISGSIEEHIVTTKTWAAQVWTAWRHHHNDVAGLISRHHVLDG